MVRSWVGPIQSLNDAWRAGRKLWVLCRGCGHVRKIDPRHLLVARGDMTLKAFQDKLRCNKCRSRRAALVVHDEGEDERH